MVAQLDSICSYIQVWKYKIIVRYNDDDNDNDGDGDADDDDACLLNLQWKIINE